MSTTPPETDEPSPADRKCPKCGSHDLIHLPHAVASFTSTHHTYQCRPCGAVFTLPKRDISER